MMDNEQIAEVLGATGGHTGNWQTWHPKVGM